MRPLDGAALQDISGLISYCIDRETHTFLSHHKGTAYPKFAIISPMTADFLWNTKGEILNVFYAAFFHTAAINCGYGYCGQMQKCQNLHKIC